MTAIAVLSGAKESRYQARIVQLLLEVVFIKSQGHICGGNIRLNEVKLVSLLYSFLKNFYFY